jgi:hypothetical protein
MHLSVVSIGIQIRPPPSARDSAKPSCATLRVRASSRCCHQNEANYRSKCADASVDGREENEDAEEQEGSGSRQPSEVDKPIVHGRAPLFWVANTSRG